MSFPWSLLSYTVDCNTLVSCCKREKKILICDNPLYLRRCSSSWQGGTLVVGWGPLMPYFVLGWLWSLSFCKDIKYWVPFSGLEHLAVEFLIENILGLLKKMYGSGKGLFSDCCISYVVLVQGYEQHSSNSIVESKWFTFDWLCLSAESFFCWLDFGVLEKGSAWIK